MSTRDARLKRLGILVAQARKAAGLTQVDLAKATGGTVGRTTVVAVEGGSATASEKSYAALEVALGLPIGVMGQVRRGEISQFPTPAGATAGTGSAVDTYTADELRVLWKALGADGFGQWLQGGNASDTGTNG